MDWTNYEKTVDMEALKKEMEEADALPEEYDEVPNGTYEVKIDKMMLKKSKKGQPMTSIWFRILEGKFKNHILFYNRVLSEGWMISKDKKFLQSLDPDFKVEFTDYDPYGEVIQKVSESCNGLVYELDYSENEDGYPTFKIKKVFED